MERVAAYSTVCADVMSDKEAIDLTGEASELRSLHVVDQEIKEVCC